MSIRKFYDSIGVDPTDVLHRFADNEKMLEKFLTKFLNDNTFEELKAAVKEKNWENVFRSAHTLKGICGNFDFKGLYNLSAKIVEEYRATNYEPIPNLFVQLEDTYLKTIESLKNCLLLVCAY